MNGTPNDLSPDQQRTIARLGHALASGAANPATDPAWTGLVAEVARTPEDVVTLVQWVARAAYLDLLADVQRYAEKVRSFTEIKRTLRRFIETLRAATNPETIRTAAQAVTDWTSQVRREIDTTPHPDPATVDLQNALATQTQQTATMSGVLKQMHDTATVTINNMR